MSTTRKNTKNTQRVKAKAPQTAKRPTKGSSGWLGPVFTVLGLIAIAAAIYYARGREQQNIQRLETTEEPDASIFHVQDIPGKGKGAIAVRDIEGSV
ncbi:hypothetical protein PQX77_000496 [Marasmius sp. AFHP31]|nr:hypothetical protein PQX77_000496 [Marasmius sp. AFHP31]